MARHRFVIPLRWADFDAMSHVNNARYLEFMQDARVSLIHAMGLDTTSLLQLGHFVARNEIDYVRPIGMDDHEVVVELWVSRFGGASYDVRYEVLDERGVVCARAKSVMVTVDVPTGAAVRIPDEVRAQLERFFEDATD